MTLCAIARDEGRYLLEWLAWHRRLRFDHVLVYSNDSTDGSDALLASLQARRIVEHVDWPDQPGRAAQLSAYADALGRAQTEWIAFLDIDEFLVLHRHATIGAFLASFADEVSGIVINQCVFGSAEHEGALVIERFQQRGPDDLYFNRWVKSIVRRTRVVTPGIHVCKVNGCYADAAGAPAERLDEDRYRPTHDVAQINHYIVKSRAEYDRKRSRGLAYVLPGTERSEDRYTDGFFHAHDRNDIMDRAAARHAAEVALQVARLRDAT